MTGAKQSVRNGSSIMSIAGQKAGMTICMNTAKERFIARVLCARQRLIRSVRGSEEDLPEGTSAEQKQWIARKKNIDTKGEYYGKNS